MTHITVIPSDIWLALHPVDSEGNNVPSNSGSSSGSELQLLRLPHPRTGVPSLFLPQIVNATSSSDKPSSHILEVQAISPHSTRSWFLEGNRVVADGKLLLMTPLDPVFVLIPILRAAQPADGSTGNFRTLDDIFEEAASRLSQGPKISAVKDADVLKLATMHCVHDALRRICDYKELTDELTVYRWSRTKLLQSLSAKVDRLSQSDVFELYPSLQRQLVRDGLLDEGKDDLRKAGRVRAICELISQYLPQDLTSELVALYDFTALDIHIRALQDETNVPIPAPPPAAVKEVVDDKKRKAPSQLSKGVSKLMKVNTSGMSKISTFFKKPAK